MRFNEILNVLSIFYTYLAAPSGGHVFDNTSSWNSLPPPAVLPPSSQAERGFMLHNFAQNEKIHKNGDFDFQNSNYYAQSFLGHTVDCAQLNFKRISLSSPSPEFQQRSAPKCRRWQWRFWHSLTCNYDPVSSSLSWARPGANRPQPNSVHIAHRIPMALADPILPLLNILDA